MGHVEVANNFICQLIFDLAAKIRETVEKRNKEELFVGRIWRRGKTDNSEIDKDGVG